MWPVDFDSRAGSGSRWQACGTFGRGSHDRMPVILRAEAEAVWLDPNIDNPEKVVLLVGPYRAEWMAADDANPALNKPSFEGPECLISPAAGASPPPV